jgi:oxaloacetate decarboxylase alpha subunit
MTKQEATFVDTSLTDGQGVHWDGAITTPQAISIAERLGQSRLAGIEVINSRTILRCLERGENPWQRVAVLSQRCPNLRKRATIQHLLDYGPAPLDVLSDKVLEILVGTLAEHGVNEIVFQDPLLDDKRLTSAIKIAATIGVTSTVAVPFTDDAFLSDNYLLERAKHFAAAGAERIMLRDEAGTATSERLQVLIPQLLAALDDTPLVFHNRCTTALGPQAALEAIKLGVVEIDTVLPALANGASLPSSINLLKALDINKSDGQPSDLDALVSANEALEQMADREDFPTAACWEFDLAPYIHRLAGDAAAWAMSKLRMEGRWRELHDFAHECARVRTDIGSPPMVPPYAQAVAEQAFINLSDEGPYSEIRPVIRRAIQQVYGSAPGDIEVSLLRRLGAKAESQCVRSPSRQPSDHASCRERQLIREFTGYRFDDLPDAITPDALAYDETSALEFLTTSLNEYSQDYAELGVYGPDEVVLYRSAKGAQ